MHPDGGVVIKYCVPGIKGTEARVEKELIAELKNRCKKIATDCNNIGNIYLRLLAKMRGEMKKYEVNI